MAYFRANSGGGGSEYKAVIGEITPSTSATTKNTKITCGFKPKFVGCFRDSGGESALIGVVYVEAMYTNKYARLTSSGTPFRAFEQPGSAFTLVSIDDDGFTLGTFQTYSTSHYRYFIIG